MLLARYAVGQSGVVVQHEGYRLLVRMDYDPVALRSVDPSRDLVVEGEGPVAPPWMPPLSIDDAGALHEQVLESLTFPLQGTTHDAATSVMKGVVARCWGFRLPLSADEIWSVLAAHGMRAELKSEACQLYEYGHALLVGVNGRPPVKRRRMPALSRGQYMTKHQRELSYRLFGHD